MNVDKTVFNKLYDYEDLNDRETVLENLPLLEENRGTHLISFYFKSIKNDTISKLRQELGESENIKQKETKKVVTKGIVTLIETLTKYQNEFKSSSGVIFVKGDLYMALIVPEELSINLYYCGKTFNLEPLLKNTHDKVWGLIVLDTQEVTIGLYINNTIKVLNSFEAFIPNKMKAGGQSAMRFDLTRVRLVDELIEKISRLTNLLYKDYKVEKVLLGGTFPTTDFFYSKNKLNSDLKAKLKAPVATCYTCEKGLEELINHYKQEYEQELKIYFEQKKHYEEILKFKDQGVIVNEKEATHLELNAKPKQIYVLTGSTNLGYYCETCKKLYYDESLCIHKKEDLKRVIEKIHYINKNGSWGPLLVGLGKVFYRLDIL